LENRFWEAVRLLEGAALDWYNSRRLTFSGATWAKWRESFLDTFAPKGWSDARSAISYCYFSGSLSEYAIKKENLLINFHSKMDDVMKITLIILGLPISIQEKIDPSEISSVETRLIVRALFPRLKNQTCLPPLFCLLSLVRRAFIA